MKITKICKRRLVAGIVSTWMLCVAALVPAQETPSLEERIQTEQLFVEPLCWVGETKPSQTESIALWNAIDLKNTGQRTAMISALEQFMEDEVYHSDPHEGLD